MATVIRKASVIKAAGNKEKIIREYIGKVNTGTSELSLALMKSPEGWEEPGQSPEFEEYTLVLKGKLVVKTIKEEIILSEGEAIVTKEGEWVKYSTPFQGGAEYVAVCLPAFSPETVHRDDQA
jgi:quercetin dioxygenase-like cupin family protein